MFQQSDNVPIIDYVFPLILSSEDTEHIHVRRFLGTAFLLGRRGYSLTCSHVVRGIENNLSAIFFDQRGNRYVKLLVKVVEHHQTEDVCLIQLLNGNYRWKSIFSFDCTPHFGWKEYVSSSVSYAVTADAFCLWKPVALEGLSIEEETNAIANDV